MVKFNENFSHDIASFKCDAWISTYFSHFSEPKQTLIRNAHELARSTSDAHKNPYKLSCYEEGLQMAMILEQLEADAELIAASLVAPALHYAELDHQDITDALGEPVDHLLKGFLVLHKLNDLHKENNVEHANALRKMLLAMVSDIRIVLLKLVERIVILRAMKHLPDDARKQKIAQETRDIYAPLANRLGIYQLKWELEDLCFFYLEPVHYKMLVDALAEKRLQRDHRLQAIKNALTQLLKNESIHARISGRSKHIYSIYVKMQKKNLSFDEIYDASALRIIVDTVDQCYAVLSLVHETWPFIQSEFDDYISHPKQNGYQSIHTVIKDTQQKNVEIQIRTQAMHDTAEMGIAAHWVYKEGKRTESSSYEEKITRLRQLLDWHKDIATHDAPTTAQHTLFADHIYVFSPQGDIIDLPIGATPLDFAYRIHSDIGHRCRGAKVNNHMVQLTQALKTGDTVSIITTREAKPSRDWLNPQLGYLITSRARAKVQHWFNTEYQNDYIQQGRELFEKECKRLNIHFTLEHVQHIADAYDLKSTEQVFASVAKGTLRLTQVINFLQKSMHAPTPSQEILNVASTPASTRSDFIIQGVDNLMTHIAKCCKPILGEAIIGYITQGFGIAVHKPTCSNIEHLTEMGKHRLVDVSWGKIKEAVYQVDLRLYADDRLNLIRDLTAILGAEHINLLSINTHTHQHKADIQFTIEISSMEQLQRILEKLKHLPNVIDVKRN